MANIKCLTTNVVYKFTFPNGKIYIGCTSNFRRRLSGYKHKAFTELTDFPIYRAIRKYGMDGFTKDILFESEDYSEVLAKEVEYIAYYQSLVPAGYNCTKGGEGTRGFTPWNKGKKLSAEHIKKFVDSREKKACTVTILKDMSTLDFISIAEAARYMGVHYNVAKGCLKHGYFIKNRTYFLSLKSDKIQLPMLNKFCKNKNFTVSNGIISYKFSSLKEAGGLLCMSDYVTRGLYNGKCVQGWRRTDV